MSHTPAHIAVHPHPPARAAVICRAHERGGREQGRAKDRERLTSCKTAPGRAASTRSRWNPSRSGACSSCICGAAGVAVAAAVRRRRQHHQRQEGQRQDDKTTTPPPPPTHTTTATTTTAVAGTTTTTHHHQPHRQQHHHQPRHQHRHQYTAAAAIAHARTKITLTACPWGSSACARCGRWAAPCG